jgi:hypothetical protein
MVGNWKLREEHWRKELHATLNGQQAFTTDEEKQLQVSKGGVIFSNKNPNLHERLLYQYRQANKDKLKVYYEANKEYNQIVSKRMVSTQEIRKMREIKYYRKQFNKYL